MLVNALTRIIFVILLAASLSIGAFVFRPIWLIPILAATWLNLRIALAMEKRNSRDILFAILIFPAEIYMWIRLGHFFRAWSKFLSQKKVDNWAAQAKAERGSGNGYLVPILVLALTLVALMVTWFQIPIDIQSNILAVGWPILAVITAIQTFLMFTQILKRHRGYKV